MIVSKDRALELFVRRLTLRSKLTTHEKLVILGLNGQIKEVSAYGDFVKVAEPVDHSCLVISGLAGRFGQNREGVRQITCLYIPGDMPDLASMMCAKSGWGLTALTRTTILRVPHADLRRITARHPGIAEALWRDCVADGSTCSEWVVNVGRRNALARVAHLLCEMAIRYEQTGHNRLSFVMPITQTGLGDATGLSSVHVNRTLRDLRLQSILLMREQHVIVHDWDKLVRVGEFDDTFMLLDHPSPRIFEAA